MNKLYLLLFFCISIGLNAQTDWCGYENPEQYVNSNRSEQEKTQLLKSIARFEQSRKLKRADDTTRIIIPVVFHILHQGGDENISDAQVLSQIDKMNLDFNGINKELADLDTNFTDLVGVCNIEFRLAAFDPNGNCTNGIYRYFDNRTGFSSLAAVNQVKPEYFWPRDQYLNCLVVKSIASSGGGTTLGFAQFPFDGDSLTDGITMVSNSIGNIGTGSDRYAAVTTHEVGHWLGLYHVWGNCAGAGSQAACECDDEVDDTPLTTGNASVCPVGRNNCGTRDNVQNFMDYSFCFVNFTKGQAARVRDVMFNIEHRRSLWTEENLIRTGVLDPPSIFCDVDFVATTERRIVCSGETLEFLDLSYHDIEKWKWSFEGGNPAVSNMEHPQITYNVPGDFTVNMTVTNSIGESRNLRKPLFVKVLNLPIANPNFVYDFDKQNTLTQAGFTNHSDKGNGAFEVYKGMGYSGNQSLVLKNHNLSSGTVTNLITPAYDFSESEEMSFSFKYAYSPVSGSNDKLIIQASRDCGENWFTRRTLQGSVLTTVAEMEGEFVPSSEMDWKESTVSIVSFKNENVIFRFMFESDGGNNLYLDDIAIAGTVGVGEVKEVPQLDIHVINPIMAGAPLVLQATEALDVNLQVLDISGKEHLNQGVSLQNGSTEISTYGLAKGTYILRLKSGNYPTAVKKLIIQ